ncbi:MAG: hypothetical protein L0220_14555 [Acidobacteria bacterium]|nr:hypothetical protein [Acidobacteriota bacterium]
MGENGKYLIGSPDFELVIREIERELLQVIHEDIARLIFLASTRDYQDGRYRHDSLVFNFTEDLADEGLAAYHREVFERVALSPLAELVRQLESYLRSLLLPFTEVLQLWGKHAPYRVLPPSDCEPWLAELFFSNVRVALASLQKNHSELIRE